METSLGRDDDMNAESIVNLEVENGKAHIEQIVHDSLDEPSSPKKRSALQKESPFFTVERLAVLDHGVDGDTHEKNPIISVATHPVDTSLLATGGHEGAVRLWTISPPDKLDPTMKEPERVHVSLLNTLTGHSSQVNTIRFSPGNGEYLASCSSDSTIRVYSKDSRWKLLNSLRGHTLDVADIAWFNESILISCSADCKTIIWDVVTGGKLQTLASEKGSSPKGVLVDPYRDYFCILFDESLVDIYRRQADGKFRHSRHLDLSKEDARNFAKATKTTIYPRRGSWDPSFQTVILPLGSRSTGNVGPCGVVYDRSNLLEPTPGEPLLSRKILAGHPARVVIVASTPCMYSTTSGDKFYITGMASVDGVVSLWCSDQILPLAVIANILGPLGVCTDSAWSCCQDKATLFLSSSDGGVTAMILRNIGSQIAQGIAPPLVRAISGGHIPTSIGQPNGQIVGDVKSAQIETRVNGKRKIQPVVEVTAPVINPTIPSQFPILPPFLPELAATYMSITLKAINNISENKVTLTCTNGWEIVRETVLVTSVAMNDAYIILGLFDQSNQAASIDILTCSDGTRIPEFSGVCIPEYAKLAKITNDNTCAILTMASMMVWRIDASSTLEGGISALIPDAPLPGLFAKDYVVEISDVYPPQLKLNSGRTARYNIRLSRWTLNS
jgi:WD40 repeat protein